MELKTFLKSTEAIVVLAGLFFTVTYGWFWGVITAAAYILLNVPSLVATIKGWFSK